MLCSVGFFMKIEITKANLIITPAPKRNKKNGIKVYLWREERPDDTTLPIATTDIIKGQRKYSLPACMKHSIKRIEF